MIDEILLEAEEKMAKAVAVAREDFATIRTGRATAAVITDAPASPAADVTPAPTAPADGSVSA